MILILALIIPLFATASAITTPTPCLPRGLRSIGFNAKFYEYKFKDEKSYLNLEYMTEGYMSGQLVGERTGITNIAEANSAGLMNVVWGNIFGFPITTSNFTVELIGYFLASESGNYNFDLYVDDSALITFGAGQAFACCNSSLKSVDGDYSLFASWTSKTNLPGSTTSSQHLTAGYYYPMRIVWANKQNPYALDFRVTTPSGKVITDYTNVYSYDDIGNEDTYEGCKAEHPVTTVTQTYTGSLISLATSTNSIFGTDVVTLFIPLLEKTSTRDLTEAYSKSHTTDLISSSAEPNISIISTIIESQVNFLSFPESTIKDSSAVFESKLSTASSSKLTLTDSTGIIESHQSIFSSSDSTNRIASGIFESQPSTFGPLKSTVTDSLSIVKSWVTVSSSPTSTNEEKTAPAESLNKISTLTKPWVTSSTFSLTTNEMLPPSNSYVMTGAITILNSLLEFSSTSEPLEITSLVSTRTVSKDGSLISDMIAESTTTSSTPGPYTPGESTIVESSFVEPIPVKSSQVVAISRWLEKSSSVVESNSTVFDSHSSAMTKNSISKIEVGTNAVTLSDYSVGDHMASTVITDYTVITKSGNESTFHFPLPSAIYPGQKNTTIQTKFPIVTTVASQKEEYTLTETRRGSITVLENSSAYTASELMPKSLVDNTNFLTSNTIIFTVTCLNRVIVPVSTTFYASQNTTIATDCNKSRTNTGNITLHTVSNSASSSLLTLSIESVYIGYASKLKTSFIITLFATISMIIF